eukprot:1695650-Pleurochrysis_carterae.AAC.3
MEKPHVTVQASTSERELNEAHQSFREPLLDGGKVKTQKCRGRREKCPQGWMKQSRTAKRAEANTCKDKATEVA